MSESMVYKALAAINTSSTWDSTASPLEVLNFNVKETIEVVQDEGIRGTRSREVERLAMGLSHVAGSFEIEPTPKEFDSILPFIMGNGAAGTYTLTDTLPDMYMQADLIAKVNTYLLRVNKATISGEPGKKIRVRLDVVGKTMTIGNAGSWSGTVPAIDLTTRPYMFYDLGSGITINSVAYSIDRFSLSIDNKIVPTFMQGQTATDLEPTDRVITLGIRTKWTSTEVALQTDQRAGTSRAASLAFTNGGVSLTMAFASLQAPPESPVLEGKTAKIRYESKYQCYTLSTTKELVVVNDSTP